MRSNARARRASNTKVSRLAKFDVVSIEDLETADIERVFALADDFAAQLERGEQITTAAGLIMATLFYEPSTRTRLSFESSMHRLGGAVISSADMQASSAAKGESLADTVRVVAGYADLIVLRHPHDGSCARRRRVCAMSGAQRRRRQPRASHANAVRPLHPAQKEGPSEGTDRRAVRRSEIWPHRPFADLCARAFRREHRRRADQRHERSRLRARAARRRAQLQLLDCHDGRAEVAGRRARRALPDAQRAASDGALHRRRGVCEKFRRGEPPAALDAFYVTRLQKERMSGKEAAPPITSASTRARSAPAARRKPS